MKFVLLLFFFGQTLAIKCYSGSMSREEDDGILSAFGIGGGDFGQEVKCPKTPLINLIDSCYKVAGNVYYKHALH